MNGLWESLCDKGLIIWPIGKHELGPRTRVPSQNTSR
jgi:hypothetical protein